MIRPGGQVAMGCSEAFLVLLMLGFLASPFVGLLILFLRLRATEARLEKLGRELVSLRLELQGLDREGTISVVPVVQPEAPPRQPEPTPSEEEESPPPEVAPPEPIPPQPVPPSLGPPRLGRPPGPPRRLVEIDWERWIGVRGAAVVGAVVLGLAGVLFLQYSIEQGLLPPTVRVAIGLLAGLGCLVGSEELRRRRRGYEATANAVAGAGVVLLYASVWAARVLYALVGLGVAFLLMVLVTLVCGTLAWRHRSRVVAVLGLVGGFATPALLASDQDNPIGLFGYLLLLNLAVLVLAVRREWTPLAALSLILTTLYQAAWITQRMGPESAWVGMGVLAVFALFYAVAAHRAPQAGRPGMGPTQAAGVLLPFLFTFHFAGHSDLGPRLYPLAALLLLLTLLARWVGRLHGQPLYGVAGAAASVAAVGVWCLNASFDVSLEWEAALSGVVLALALQVAQEFWKRGETAGADPVPAETIAAASFMALSVAVPLLIRGASTWPWLAAWTGLAALLWRQSIRREAIFLPLPASIAVAVGAGSFFAVHQREAMLVYGLAAAVAFQAAALARRNSARRWAEAAAGVLPLVLLFFVVFVAPGRGLAEWKFHAAALVGGALAALAATRLGWGGAFFASLAAVGAAAMEWSWRRADTGDPAALATGFAAYALAAVAFTVWPFAAGRAFRSQAWAWYASALAGPFFFAPLLQVFDPLFGSAAKGILPLAFAALSVAGLAWSRKMWTSADSLGRSRVVWFSAVALGFVSAAIPLQLEKEWITIGWALQGVAVIALWRRLDHPGLKYFGLALLAATAARLVLNPELLQYHPRSGFPVFNWLLYTYLVPAGAMAWAARLLTPVEIPRQRPWEESLYSFRQPVAGGFCGLLAIAVVFVWINLAVFDYFATGESLMVSFARQPARDLTLSLCWIAYALALLAMGMAGGAKPLRWLSLAVLMLALAKVFLHDLGELEDLYRVASLLGLALSLLAVSLAYQRFVFSRGPLPKEDR